MLDAHGDGSVDRVDTHFAHHGGQIILQLADDGVTLSTERQRLHA
jgi:hypothetical protein